MPKILVLCATREGHTPRIAARVADDLRRAGLAVDRRSVADAPGAVTGYDGAVLLSPVHAGEHEPDLVAFADRHAAALSRIPTSFLSIGLFEAVAEDAHASPGRREAAAAEVHAAIDRFVAEVGFRPRFVHALAGALPYPRVGRVRRAFLWWMARAIGLPDDFAREHVLTDWDAVDRHAGELAAAVLA